MPLSEEFSAIAAPLNATPAQINAALRTARREVGSLIRDLDQSQADISGLRTDVNDLMDDVPAKLAPPWTRLDASQFDPAPPVESYASGVFTAIPAWAANTAYSLGNFVKPSTTNGYVYECVAAGTSHATTEPTWGTTLGGNTTDNTVTWRCRGLGVIGTPADMSATLAAGMPLKFVYSATRYYGIVLYVNTTRIAFAGAPLLTNATLTEVHYGRTDRVVQRWWNVAGAYANSTQDLLANINNAYEMWLAGRAYLVDWYVRHRTNAGTSNGRVNLKLGGNAVSVDSSNEGPQPTTSWVQNSHVAVHATNYAVDYTEAIEIACTVVDSGSDSSDLSVAATFVME